MLQGDMPNDFDVYFDDIKVATEVVNYYLENVKKTDKVSKVEARPSEAGDRVRIFLKSVGVVFTEDADNENYDYFECTDLRTMEEYFDKWQFKNRKKKFGLISMTSNAITLNDNIQIITRFVGNPEYIHQNFDFVHCTNYYSPGSGLILNQPALESIMARRLNYVGSLFPICSLFRIRKFVKRGWTITAGEILKISWDVNALNLHDIAVLEDQLIGVDSAYFTQAIGILKDHKTQGEELDRAYLFKVLDECFDEAEDTFIEQADVEDNENEEHN